MIFFLGTHHPHWLSLLGVPLFVSRRSMDGRKTLPRAVAPWALDSGGFSELTIHGEWRMTARAYVDFVRRCADEVGLLAWAAPQDWMARPTRSVRSSRSSPTTRLATTGQTWSSPTLSEPWP